MKEVRLSDAPLILKFHQWSLVPLEIVIRIRPVTRRWGWVILWWGWWHGVIGWWCRWSISFVRGCLHYILGTGFFRFLFNVFGLCLMFRVGLGLLWLYLIGWYGRCGDMTVVRCRWGRVLDSWLYINVRNVWLKRRNILIWI